MTASRLDAAVSFALANPTRWPTDIRAVIEGGTFDPPPWNILKGPVVDRGPPAGAIAIDGASAAVWGDTMRPDMIFSVTKSYIGALAIHALESGAIPGLHAAVSATVDHPLFASPRNREVTWLQFLQQTSEWEGTIWGIPDTVDRDRQLSPTDDPARFDRATPLRSPGTYWDYNDARVNALCLALTLTFGRNLAEVAAGTFPFLADRSRWQWRGYGDSSTVVRGSRPLEVVVGGGHWGGGLVTSVMQDLAFGQMVCDAGTWEGRQILSRQGLEAMLTPCRLQPVYGALWWLNTGRMLVPGAPASSVFATGVGMNAIWIDPNLRLVAVVRWIDEPAFAGFVDRVMIALG